MSVKGNKDLEAAAAGGHAVPKWMLLVLAAEPSYLIPVLILAVLVGPASTPRSTGC